MPKCSHCGGWVDISKDPERLWVCPFCGRHGGYFHPVPLEATESPVEPHMRTGNTARGYRVYLANQKASRRRSDARKASA